MHPEGIDSKLLVGRAEMDSDQHCTQAGVPRGKFGSDQFGSSTVGHQHCAKPQASAYHTENPPMYVLKRVTPIRPVEHCFLKGHSWAADRGVLTNFFHLRSSYLGRTNLQMTGSLVAYFSLFPHLHLKPFTQGRSDTELF